MILRRIIPPDIYAHLLHCHEVEPPHRHTLTDCPGPANEIDLVALANSLIADGYKAVRHLDPPPP